VQYLKAENEDLWSRVVGRVGVTQRARSRLVKVATLIRSKLGSRVSIVSLATILLWMRQDETVEVRRRSSRKPGRPRTNVTTRRRIVKMAKETTWGYSRIRGEPLKLNSEIMQVLLLRRRSSARR
jgi:putative transposase